MEQTRRYTLEVSPFADIKMQSHFEFLARVSVDASECLREEMFERLDFIESDPECFARHFSSIYPDAILRYSLCGAKRRYRIVFEVIDNVVYVHDVQDCRQGADKNLA